MGMKELIEKQRFYYTTGVTRDVAFRLCQLKRLKKAIQSYERKIGEAFMADLHKSAYETYLTEISIVYQELEQHIRNLRRWSKPRRVKTPLHLMGAKSRIIFEPLGVVLIIAPWNYPFQLLISPLIGALAAGNCAVLKPSPYVPRISRVIAEMIASVYDQDYVAVAEGGRNVNTALLAERFDYIFFTGSPSLGKVVMKAAAEYLTPVTLELGGKSPCIVAPDADIERTARRVVWGKFLNAGQTCIAPDYLMAHVDVKEKLIERIGYYIRRFYGEDPEKSPDYARIVRIEAVERIEGLMKKGRIRIGGSVQKESRYIAPTVIDEVLPDDPVMQEEIFGPVLPVLEYRQESEVIRYINAREKPLALYYFGRPSDARRIFSSTTSGGGCVNDTVMHIANSHLPFGGVGHSGMGRYHGRESFLTFSNCRSVLWATTWWEIPLRYPPFKSLALLKKILH